MSEADGPRRRFGVVTFVVAPPGAGAEAVAEFLARSPDLWTIPGGHVGAPDDLLRRAEAFAVDRRGMRPPPQLAGLRLLVHAPAASVRALAAELPTSHFLYVHRDAVDAIACACSAGTAPDVAAEQWRTTTARLLDDLVDLARERWCATTYERVVGEPEVELRRLARLLGVRWDEPPGTVPATAPAVDELDRAAARRVAPRVTDAAVRSAATVDIAPPATGVDTSGFASAHTSGFVGVLDQLGASLVVSTYQSGRVILMRADEGRLNTHFRVFQTPMGLAVRPGRLVIGTRSAVWDYRNHAAVATRLQPEGKHDACYLPHSCRVTGDIRIHDVEVAGGETWVVNTAFSCLATLDDAHSFVPRWKPPWISALAAEDRCHVNGLAVVDDKPKYVTAFGQTDTPGGWRENKAFGGLIIDVETNELVADHLCMPHSPRWHDGKLWVLESGKGTLSTVDLGTGSVDVVAELPGFTRGLAFAGPIAFVGLSLVRESLFDGVPIVGRDDLACGVWAVDTRTGDTAFVRFSGIVQEIFDVKLLPHRFPEVAEPGDRHVETSFIVPSTS